eukprot:scaffold77621_cov65-Phaeocystis_antarctica.AAC.8
MNARGVGMAGRGCTCTRACTCDDRGLRGEPPLAAVLAPRPDGAHRHLGLNIYSRDGRRLAWHLVDTSSSSSSECPCDSELEADVDR